MLRKLLLKLANGVPREDFENLRRLHLHFKKDMEKVVEIHNAQGAWEAMKKQNRRVN